jgi:hypothetical protein
LGGPALQPSQTRLFRLTGACGVPNSAVALAVNVTAATGAAGSYTLYPGNQPNPGTTTLSFSAGQVRANNALVLLATDGTGGIDVRNNSTGTNHFILDINGYFQ